MKAAANPPRVEAILSGAAAAFSEKGFAATTMRQIAHASGSSLGGIYHHFDSKEAILRAIIAGNFRRVLESLDQRLDGIDDARLGSNACLISRQGFPSFRGGTLADFSRTWSVHSK